MSGTPKIIATIATIAVACSLAAAPAGSAATTSTKLAVSTAQRTDARANDEQKLWVAVVMPGG